MNIEKDREEDLYKIGQGNWRAFNHAGYDLQRVFSATELWSQEISSIEKPWLCWNVDDAWCLIQQKLVRSVGWTPVIGFDPRVGAPKNVLNESVVVDFNKELQLPILYPHFVMEFVFRFCDRLAFWHSDLLVRKPLMAQLADTFEHLVDGRTAAVLPLDGWRDRFSTKKRRFWELVGCTTKSASLSQFENGCGWWMAFAYHPRCPSDTERAFRQTFYWDHGSGIYFWQKRCGGKVDLIRGKAVHEGHFTKIGNKDYIRSNLPNTSDATRSMHSEINNFFDISRCAAQLNLSDFLDQQ